MVPLRLSGPSGGAGQGYLDIPGGNVVPYQGLVLYLQATILDTGAVLDVAITKGLELDIGY